MFSFSPVSPKYVSMIYFNLYFTGKVLPQRLMNLRGTLQWFWIVYHAVLWLWFARWEVPAVMLRRHMTRPMSSSRATVLVIVIVERLWSSCYRLGTFWIQRFASFWISVSCVLFGPGLWLRKFTRTTSQKQVNRSICTFQLRLVSYPTIPIPCHAVTNRRKG